MGSHEHDKGGQRASEQALYLICSSSSSRCDSGPTRPADCLNEPETQPHSLTVCIGPRSWVAFLIVERLTFPRHCV